MTAKIYRSKQARADILQCFVYLAENAGIAIAERFLKNTQLSFELLSQNPLIGSQLKLKNPKLAEIRKWRVSNFSNILIFYIQRKDSISILRVLHAAQDWWELLGLDLP